MRFDEVYEVVRQIPEGKVMTYGEVARRLGEPRAARVVGWALHANRDEGVPCHRVVARDGRLADGFAFGGAKEQRRRLEAEGVKFDRRGRVKMKTSEPEYPDISIWLVPEREQENRLRKVIDRLAGRYDSNGFIPHLTLYHLGNAMTPKDAIRVVRDAIRGVPPIEVEALKMDASETFTQTLYVVYRKSEALAELYRRLASRMGAGRTYQLRPHLSLIYSHKMSFEDKRREMTKINCPKSLELDRVMVVVKEGTMIAEEKDILAWQVVFEAKLSSRDRL
jgi:methylated-DNA-protein-cysteine methyltransferase-like protein